MNGTDKLNLVFCQFASLVRNRLVFLHLSITLPHFKANSFSIPPGCGYKSLLFLLWKRSQAYFRECSHMLCLDEVFPSHCVHKLVFIFSMGYLVFIHWFRWYIMREYYIDVTGPLMKREAISQVPDLLEYLSYIFSFQTILTGPLCFYTDYQKFISGENLVVDNKQTPNPIGPALKKIGFAICCLVLICCFGLTQAEVIAEPEYLRMSWFTWWPLFFFVIFMQRVQYYYAWTLADAGQEKWDLVTNVDPWKVESALSFKETLDGWNMTTMYWLRRVAYDRVPKNYRTVSTYLLSAMWHGFFVGYYMTFLTGAIITVGARNARRCLRHHFQSSLGLKRFYDALTFLATKVALIYTTFPFVTMHLNPDFTCTKNCTSSTTSCLIWHSGTAKDITPQRTRPPKEVVEEVIDKKEE
uniref:Uncharacterized protein n=1 Tax=Ditylenchus dipsaci TaxID=166011 RepID=A0A915ER68_9BILA